MSAAATLLATAAVAVGTVTAMKAVRRRIVEGERRLAAMRERQAKRRETEVLDLEADEATGVYAMRERQSGAIG
ncbi:hypothetical protein [Parvularcula dongshanensis]|uniref:Heme exporter protein D n=1 Tax=Parvularcula dongshanensis TaxID=1173995 RepID=A0A840I7E8_9PROT|nr:hypothetical protein [Parvularcula dongshanensis]MBB4660028.1 heme exporter protein D [Parvularcula dongshanensis]